MSELTYNDVTVEEFKTYDSQAGLAARLSIPKPQRLRFLGIYKTLRDNGNLYVSLQHKEIGTINVPIHVKSHQSSKTKNLFTIRVDFPDSVLENIQAFFAQVEDGKIDMTFFIDKDEAPKASYRARISLNARVHGLFSMLAEYENMTPKAYKEAFKKEANIKSLTELTDTGLREIITTLQNVYENLEGTENYKRINPSCELCDQQPVDVHHIIYRSHDYSEDRDKFRNLLSLCRKHHDEFHENPTSFVKKHGAATNVIDKILHQRPELAN